MRSALGSRASALRCAVGSRIAGLPERYSTAAAASEEAEGSWGQHRIAIRRLRISDG